MRWKSSVFESSKLHLTSCWLVRAHPEPSQVNRLLLAALHLGNKRALRTSFNASHQAMSKGFFVQLFVS